MPIDWDKLDWSGLSDFDKPDFERDETLDLSVLDFGHFIWLRFFEDKVIAIGDEEGFWQTCEEEQDYFTPKEFLDQMLAGDMITKVARNVTGCVVLE